MYLETGDGQTSPALENCSAGFEVRPRRLDVLLLTLIALCAVYLHYEIGSRQHVVYIPFLQSYLDSSLYPNDVLLQTRDAHVTYFWWLLSFLVRAVDSLPIALFLVRVIASIAMGWAVFDLALVITKDRLSAYLVVMTLAIGYGRLFAHSDIEICRADITQTTFAAPFLVWSLSRFMRGRYISAFLLAGAMTSIHCKSAAYVFAMFLFWMVFHTRIVGVRRILLCLVVFIVASLPEIVPIVQTLRALPSLDPADYREYLYATRMRAYLHMYPSSWGIRSWLKGLSFLALGAVALSYLWREERRGDQCRILAYFMAAVGVMCVIGTVFVEWLPVWRPILNFTFWRSTKFVYLFGLICISHYFVSALYRERYGRLAVWAAMCAIIFWPYLRLIQLVPFWAFGFWPLIRGKWARGIILVLAVACAAVHPWPAPMILITLFAGLVAFALSISLLARLPRLTPTTVTACMLFVLPALFILPAIVGYEQLLPKKIRGRPRVTPGGSWYYVQRWCEENTKPDDVFITPFWESGFRAFSKRSSFVEFRDGPSCAFNPPAMLEWLRRVRLYGDDSVLFANSAARRKLYQELTQEDLLRLAQEASASYIIVRAPKALSLPLVHEMRFYRVYKVKEQNTGKDTPLQDK